jgi:spore coat polysaccharide biosynthesis protein SpsF
VLDRVLRAAQAFGFTDVGIFGADNPVIDPAVCDLVIGAYLEGGFDYVTNNFPQTFPDGQEVEVLSRSALERVAREATEERQRIHLLTYIWENSELFAIRNLRHDPPLTRERWTLDYPEDLDLLRAVMEALAPADPIFGMDALLAYLDEHPEVRALNSAHVDSYEWLGHSRAELPPARGERPVPERH